MAFVPDLPLDQADAVPRAFWPLCIEEEFPPPPTQVPDTVGAYPDDADGERLGSLVIQTGGHLLSGFGHDAPASSTTVLDCKGRLLRPLWLRAADTTLVNILDGIRTSHETNEFSDPPLALLTDAESRLLSNIRANTERLNVYLGNENDQFNAYDGLDVCLSCMKPNDHFTDIEHATALMKSCGQDANVARESLFNTRRAEIDASLEKWTESYILYCKKAIVRTMLGITDAPFNLKFDDEFKAWIGNQADNLKANAHQRLLSLEDETSTWVEERLTHLRNCGTIDLQAKVDTYHTECADHLAEQNRIFDDQIAVHRRRRETEVDAAREEMVTALREAEAYAKRTIEAEKSRLNAEYEHEIGTFKHNLKIESERQKDNATKAAKAGVKSIVRATANRPSRQNTPLHRPKPLPSSPSIYTVPDSSVVVETTPTPQTTPRASPAPLSPLVITAPRSTEPDPAPSTPTAPPRPGNADLAISVVQTMLPSLVAQMEELMDRKVAPLVAPLSTAVSNLAVRMAAIEESSRLHPATGAGLHPTHPLVLPDDSAVCRPICRPKRKPPSRPSSTTRTPRKPRPTQPSASPEPASAHFGAPSTKYPFPRISRSTGNSTT
jgi:hypothetical protein